MKLIRSETQTRLKIGKACASFSVMLILFLHGGFFFFCSRRGWVALSASGPVPFHQRLHFGEGFGIIQIGGEVLELMRILIVVVELRALGLVPCSVSRQHSARTE